MLTVDNKRARTCICRQLLQLYEVDPEGFISRFVTVDEVWIHHYDPETKAMSLQWRKRGERAPLKYKVGPSAGKVMAIVIWDSEGILMIDYLEHGDTINGQYCANQIARLW